MSGNQLLGGKAMITNLQKLRRSIPDEAYNQLIEIAIVEGESEAKKSLTTHRHVDTGRLRASIHTEYFGGDHGVTYKDDSGKSYNGKLSRNPAKDEVYFGTNVEYSEPIEAIDSYIGLAVKLVRATMERTIGTGLVRFIKKGKFVR